MSLSVSVSVLTLCLGNNGVFLGPLCPLRVGSSKMYERPDIQLIWFVPLSSFVLCARAWAQAGAVESFDVPLGHVGEWDSGVQNSWHPEILRNKEKVQ